MATLALVDDHRLFREGLRALLRSQPDLQVVAEAGDAREAFDAVAVARPDLMIIDVLLPGVSGIDLLREMSRQAPRRPILALSMLRDGATVARASISRRTVETHRARILRKLGARSATDLVRLAARQGVLQA